MRKPSLPDRTDGVCVSMAGGRGTRFRPLSRPGRPEQLLPLGRRGSLLRETCERVVSLVGADRVLVITQAAQAVATAAELPGLSPRRPADLPHRGGAADQGTHRPARGARRRRPALSDGPEPEQEHTIMTIPSTARRLACAVLLVSAALTLSSCNGNSAPGGSLKDALFGNGQKDTSPVVARVGGVDITQRDLELRLKEMPEDVKSQYADPAEQKQLLRLMIGEVLMAQDALRTNVTANPDVMQQLISMRRTTLIDAYKELVLWKDLEPSPEQIREEYELNKMVHYQVAASVRARHIQCNTKAEADAAWARLHAGGKESAFPYVVAAFSRNSLSTQEDGVLGWFNRGGFIGALSYGSEFSETVFDWPVGLHPPVKIGGHWHIVEILEREPGRTLSLAEVKDRIVDQLKPGLQQAAKDEFLAARLKEAPVEYFGEFRPGKGRSAEELLKQGMLAANFERKLAIYDTLLEDYPDSKEAPMALFMKANLYLDTTGDMHRCRRYLGELLARYPQSEVRDQAQFMLDNLGKIDFKSPSSIQELNALPR